MDSGRAPFSSVSQEWTLVWTLVALRAGDDVDLRAGNGPGYPQAECGLIPRSTWTLVARLAIIPWTLVADSNN